MFVFLNKVPYWMRTILLVSFSSLVFVFFTGGALFVAQLFSDTVQYADTLLSILFVSVVVIISSAIGAIASLHKGEKVFADELIKKYKTEIEDKIESVANRLKHTSETSTKQCTDCEKTCSSLHSYLMTFKESIDLVLNKVGLGKKAIVPLPELIEIERTAQNNSEIWVATTLLELEEHDLKNVIFNNLSKKIKYTYFLPMEEPYLATQLIQLFKEGFDQYKIPYTEANDLLTIFKVPKHFLYMTVIVYNAKKLGSEQVLVKFPLRSEVGRTYLSFNVPTDDIKAFLNSLHFFRDPHNCSKSEELKFDFTN